MSEQMGKLLTLEEIIDLQDTYKGAARRLSEAVAERFPIGMPVLVYRGGKEFRGTVFAHPTYWSDPDHLRIESHTGWKFSACFTDCEEI